MSFANLYDLLFVVEVEGVLVFVAELFGFGASGAVF